MRENLEKGFSMVELAMIIVIIGILAITLNFSGSSQQKTFEAEGFSDVFKSDLRYTQILSMSLNQRYRIAVGASSYQIQDPNGSPIVHPEGGSSVAYPSGLTITPTTTIVFDALGRPYDTGGTLLASTVNFSVSSGGTTKTVSVIPQTGYIQ